MEFLYVTRERAYMMYIDRSSRMCTYVKSGWVICVLFRMCMFVYSCDDVGHTIYTHIHGVGKSWGRSGDFWEWCSLLSDGPSYVSVFLIFSISSIVRTGASLQIALKIVAWSFDQLWKGKHAEFYWDGRPTHDPRHKI